MKLLIECWHVSRSCVTAAFTAQQQSVDSMHPVHSVTTSVCVTSGGQTTKHVQIDSGRLLAVGFISLRQMLFLL